MNPKFETASGAIDGLNTVFSVSSPYTVGTLAVLLNGQLKSADLEDGFSEASPPTGTFTMNEAPLPGDTVQAFYLDTEETPDKTRFVFGLEAVVGSQLAVEVEDVDVSARIVRVSVSSASPKNIKAQSSAPIITAEVCNE